MKLYEYAAHWIHEDGTIEDVPLSGRTEISDQLPNNSDRFVYIVHAEYDIELPEPSEVFDTEKALEEAREARKSDIKAKIKALQEQLK